MTQFRFNQILKFIHNLQVFISIQLLTVIYITLACVVWGSKKGFAWVAWLLIYIARVGVKVRVGLEKLSFETIYNCKWYFPSQLKWLLLCYFRHPSNNSNYIIKPNNAGTNECSIRKTLCKEIKAKRDRCKVRQKDRHELCRK